MQTQRQINQAYQFCQQLARQHYENFPVASVLLPSSLRRPIAAIYAFARTADDIADEDRRPAAIRLQLLNRFSEALHDCSANLYAGDEPIFIALQHSIQQHNLPAQLLEDLLTAFRQDIVKTRYADFAEVLAYCRYSANPIGRLLLHLANADAPTQLRQSDAICTALQLINFFQDIQQDLTEQNRIYLPQDRLALYAIQEADLLKRENTAQLAPLLRQLYQETEQILLPGISLGTTVPGRLGWEIRAMTLGGLYTLDKLKQQPDGALLSRPRLSRITLLNILRRSLSHRHFQQATYRFS